MPPNKAKISISREGNKLIATCLDFNIEEGVSYSKDEVRKLCFEILRKVKKEIEFDFVPIVNRSRTSFKP